MVTKNTTVRFDKEMIEEIDQNCQDVGCTRNDWMKDAVSEKLQREKTQDQEVIEDIKSETKPTIEEKPKSTSLTLIDDDGKETELTKDSDGVFRPKTHTVEVDFDPKDYEVSNKTPELENPTVVNEPLDNSGKTKHMGNFNGQYFPKAELYNK